MYKLQQIVEGQTQEQIDEAKEAIEKHFDHKIKKLQRQLQKDIREATSKVRQQTAANTGVGSSAITGDGVGEDSDRLIDNPVVVGKTDTDKTNVALK